MEGLFIKFSLYASSFIKLIQEYEDGKTPEARFVKGASELQSCVFSLSFLPQTWTGLS